MSIGPVQEAAELDGVPVRVGGKGKEQNVPIVLEGVDGFYSCVASRPLAREIARYLFVTEIRVSGRGSWLREADGRWQLQRFVIQDFRVLEDRPVDEVLRELREVEGSEWKETEDPIAELLCLK